ncbi:MAG: DUF2299 domain-containing protein [Candidatus Lokiarchaeota archaeon]|nr:DUF2299 domain-containing protein [Candidatus Lokiarchaeota archaeon]
MNETKSIIKKLIQEYLLDEGLLRTKLPDTEHKLEFGFQFVFPPGPVSQKMVVFKPKNKDIIIISNPIQIAPQHVEALNSLEPTKKLSFFMELRKFFLAKDVFYRIDTQNNRYEITDQIFLKKDGTISKNSFYKSIRKVFTCSAFSNIILNECCYGKVKSEDASKSDDFTSNFSLYS